MWQEVWQRIPKAELANIPRIWFRNILGNWGLRPQFLGLSLEYSGSIGQLSLGDPLPYLLPYLKKTFDIGLTGLRLDL